MSSLNTGQLFVKEMFKYCYKHKNKLGCRVITSGNFFEIEHVSNMHVYFKGFYPEKFVTYIPNFSFYVTTLTFSVPNFQHWNFKFVAADRTQPTVVTFINNHYGSIENMFQMYLMGIPLETLLDVAFENWGYFHDGK